MAINWDRRMQEWAVSPQTASPFFSLLPAEIREDIYRRILAIEEIPFKHDFHVRNDHDLPGCEDDDIREELPKTAIGPSRPFPWHDVHPWTSNRRRPETAHRPDIPKERRRDSRHTNILLVCRQAFLEARNVLFTHEEILLKSDFTVSRYRGWDPELYAGCQLPTCKCTDAGRLANRPRVHFERCFTRVRLHFPEKHVLKCLKHMDFSKLEHLRITPTNNVDLSNWGGYDQALDSQAEMVGDYGCFTPSGRITRPWVRELVNMPSLKTLTLDFEASAYRREDHTDAVDRMQREWRLPLDPRTHVDGAHYLSAEGIPRSKMSWRTDWTKWPPFCLKCCYRPSYVAHDRPYDADETQDCGEHVAMMELVNKGFGPRMYCWTLTFTPRQCSAKEVDEGYCVAGKEGMYCGGFEVATRDIRNGDGDDGQIAEEGNDDLATVVQAFNAERQRAGQDCMIM